MKQFAREYQGELRANSKQPAPIALMESPKTV